MFGNSSVVVMYGVTPCHAGSGSSLGVVDLPIQRERATNWPVVQASGVKGAFRANFDQYKNKIAEEDKSKIKDFDKLTESIFGSADNNSGFAGSLCVSDAKILAYPMRSNVAPFVWITCPSVLKRLLKDLDVAGKLVKKPVTVSIPPVEKNEAIVINGDIKSPVITEDYELTIKNTPNELKAGLAAYIGQAERLLLVSDEVFDYGVSECTQIMAQIAIKPESGTTKDGSLRYQEELPSDTIMYAVVQWGDTKNSKEESLKAATIKKFICEQVIAKHIQLGGDETCGRGIFELSWN